MDVRLTTLGIPSVSAGGEERKALPGRPVAFGLFVFLALEREVTRDRLLGLFWPESTQDKARHTLSQTLYDLRKELGEEWVETQGNLVTTTSSLWVDALEFETMAKGGNHREAVALYGGPFLEGCHLARTHGFEEWVERQRAHLARRHRASVDTFIGQAKARGEVESALQAAWRWAGLDPLDDGAQHHLIQLLAESGNRTEALAQYDRYWALLREELGLEPLDETRELVEGIREGTMVTPLPGRGEGGVVAPREAIADRKEPAQYLDRELGDDLQVLRPIGRGSMADIYLAREPGLKRLVALKILSSELSTDATARKRFEREAQAAARIHHPNVCTVHRVGALSDGTPFYTSPFVKGISMAHRLQAEGRLSPTEVRGVVRDVSSALAAAHKLGIIHRDVRPGNVLFEEETGRHYLCDFGIAGVLETGEDLEEKLTRTGEILGHPSYISPEQMTGEPLTDRTDLYSLGVLAHELLTGHPPPAGRDTPRRPRGSVSAPDLEPLRDYIGASDPDLVDLIGRCLAVQPAHRPSAADVARKCEDLARRDTGTPATDAAALEHPVRAVFERRLPAILAAYIAGAWGILEFTQYLVNNGLLLKIVERLVFISSLFGFGAATIVGWFHGQKGRQTMPPIEKWLLALVGVGWVVGCVAYLVLHE